jgi:hypothetical protein
METLVSSITQAVGLAIVLIGGRAVVRGFNAWKHTRRAARTVRQMRAEHAARSERD